MNEKQFSTQEKLARRIVGAKIPDFIAVLITAIFSHSLIVWLDVLNDFVSVTQTSMVKVFSTKFKGNSKYKYNYGTGKLESIISICCDMLSIAGMVCIFVTAVYKLFHPDQPSKVIIVVVVLKVFNIATDIFFLFYHKRFQDGRVAKSISSSTVEKTTFDIISFFALLVTYIFIKENFAMYIAPIVCIFMSLYFTFQNCKNIGRSIEELSDKTLPEEVQLKVLRSLTKYFDSYIDCVSVNSRLIEEEMHIELNLIFEEGMTYQEITQLLEKISKQLNKDIGKCTVNFII